MYKRILVAVDGSEPATRALQEAVRLAGEQRAQLCLIFVIDLRPILLSGAPAINFDQLLQSWREEAGKVLEGAAGVARAAGLEPETRTLEASVQRISDVILEEAESWRADLIVLGTHGRHGIGRMLLGSVAEGVARGAPVPVLLVRFHQSENSR